MYAAEIKKLRKEYKQVTAVNDVSFTINDGEIISLLGMNGAGKTTVIKMLSCLTKPTSGEAFIYGKSILRPYRRKAAYRNLTSGKFCSCKAYR